jgi:hypothetical protein
MGAYKPGGGCKQPAAEDHNRERINEYPMAGATFVYSFSIR